MLNQYSFFAVKISGTLGKTDKRCGDYGKVGHLRTL